MIVYVDTSAAVKLFANEAESHDLQRFLDQLPETAEIVSSVLLETEMRRAVGRKGISQSVATEILAGVTLLEATRALFTSAGLFPGDTLKSLDALHLASAVDAGADLLIAYDRRLLEGAAFAGLRTTSPG